MSALSSNPFAVANSRSDKLLFLGDPADLPEDWLNQLRSLHIEHVSPSLLIGQEICRRSPLGQTAELARQRGTHVPAEIVVALVRRWFMARKPDAGFALTGFPATLLQARILDEWLDTRDEGLDAVVPLPASDLTLTGLVSYYRTHGLLFESSVPSSRL